MRSRAEWAAELARLRARRGEVAADLDDAREEQRAAREVYAGAVAHGAPREEVEAARDRERAATEAVEALDPALPILDREVEAAAEELSRAQAKEASAEADAKVAEAMALVEKLAAALDTALDAILAQAAEVSTATSAAWRAEVRASEATGDPTPLASRVNGAWPQQLGEFLARARAYRDSRLREVSRTSEAVEA